MRADQSPLRVEHAQRGNRPDAKFANFDFVLIDVQRHERPIRQRRLHIRLGDFGIQFLAPGARLAADAHQQRFVVGQRRPRGIGKIREPRAHPRLIGRRFRGVTALRCEILRLTKDRRRPVDRFQQNQHGHERQK